MRISQAEVNFLRENGYGEFVVRSSSHSKKYHVLCSTEARKALEVFHSKNGVATTTVYKDKNGNYIKE